MNASLQTIAYGALRDLGELRPGMNTSTDALADILSEANSMVDQWAQDRLFIYYGAAPGTILVSFPDLSTSFAFAPGYVEALRKNLAVKIAPMMKIYFKIESPLLAELTAEAAATKAALYGIGVAS